MAQLSLRNFGRNNSNGMDPNVNYYDILGVPEFSSGDKVKKGFYVLAKKYHPDMSKNLSEGVRKEYEDKFKSITAAYDILSDPVQKNNYDLVRDSLRK